MNAFLFICGVLFYLGIGVAFEHTVAKGMPGHPTILQRNVFVVAWPFYFFFACLVLVYVCITFLWDRF